MAEHTQSILNAFKRDDEDSTGVISLWRLRALCKELGHDEDSLTRALASFRIACGDTCGGVDYADFVEWMFNGDPIQEKQKCEITGKMKTKKCWKKVATTAFTQTQSLAEMAEEALQVSQEGVDLDAPDRISMSPEESARSFLQFSPALLQYCLCNAEPTEVEISCPIVKCFRVALLLIDVSGFTRMSVKLGAEQTRKHTSIFFDQIIQCIANHGGDVLKFLGDALLVAWPASTDASEEEQSNLAVAAAACASQVMGTLNGYKISEDILLTLHGGLAVGDVHAFDVGDSTRREFLIGGTVLSEIGDMESEASSGQLVMSQRFASLLPPSATLKTLASGHVRLDLDSGLRNNGARNLITDHLALQFSASCDAARLAELMCSAQLFQAHMEAHVPATCREHVHGSALEDIGEMRHVTTLFLCLDMLVPALNAGDAEVVQAAFVVINQAVQYTGGVVRQFVLDDKGCVAILAWGLPRAAYGYGHDATRAIQCAFHIFHGLHDCPMFVEAIQKKAAGPHIGIAAGEVYVGLVGGARRCEYAMVGPSVNLSARLMGKARPWHILVEETVHDDALKALGDDADWIFESHPAVQAKGYDHLVAVFMVEPHENQHIHAKHNFLDDFTQLWGSLELRVQMVGKIASVLAEGRDGCMIDFPQLALVGISSALEIATYVETKEALAIFQSSGFFRVRRGAHRGSPLCTFTVESVHKWMVALATAEFRAEILAKYADWSDQHDPTSVRKVHKSLTRGRTRGLA